MLRALAEILSPGGRMAFLTIHVATGLSTAELERAEAVGPSAVTAPADHVEMMSRAGFVSVAARDLTDDFIGTTRAWLRELEARADVLEPLQPPGEFVERQEERRRMLNAAEDGLLRRSLFTAQRR